MIEVNGVIYRNLEEQVQKNKDDIENLKNQQSGDDSDIEQIDNRLTEVETTLTEITPDVMRALKTPISAPNETKIVAVDSSNSQEMLSVGTGLVVENNTLKSTGGTEIIDNLTSSSISAGLSANQGRVLDNKITTLSQTVNSKANQSSLDLTNQNVTQNTNNISTINGQLSTINGQISNLDSQISTNTENIEFLQSDVAGKTNVTINNVHQDYVNFSSDPQTQLNNLNTSKVNKNKSIELVGRIYLSSNNNSISFNNINCQNGDIFRVIISGAVSDATEGKILFDNISSGYGIITIGGYTSASNVSISAQSTPIFRADTGGMFIDLTFGTTQHYNGSFCWFEYSNCSIAPNPNTTTYFRHMQGFYNAGMDELNNLTISLNSGNFVAGTYANIYKVGKTYE